MIPGGKGASCLVAALALCVSVDASAAKAAPTKRPVVAPAPAKVSEIAEMA